MSEDYISLNKQSWNAVTPVHIASEFYAMDKFMAGKNSLNEIELKWLCDVRGKKILHLQCHFGQDTISLARMGASVTGLDFSEVAVAKARLLAEDLNVDAKFVCCDVYSAKEVLKEQFDIVFTSYGTIGWLPDLNKWGDVINHCLKPGGKFIMAEFHPVVWMFDNDFTKVQYSYFNVEEIVEESEGTYTDRDAPIQSKTVNWNHSLTEVFSALESNGLRLKAFEEVDYSPYNCFRHTEEFEPSKFCIAHFGRKIPMVYVVVAEKKMS